MNHTALPTRFFCAVAAAALLVASGCQSTGSTAKYNPFAMFGNNAKSKANSSGDGTDGVDFSKPVRMAVIWNETAVAPPAGGQATRGFGGRVYFYDNNNEPVRVNGQLHVYAYDDTGEDDQSQRVPDREYIFKADKLQARFSETSIGPSYNVWLPWDKVGGYRKTVSLIPVFKPEDGFVVRSEQSLAILPGRDPNNTIEGFDSGRSMVRQVNAVIEGNQSVKGSLIDGQANSSPGKRRQATTIRVPKRLANRMRQAKRGSQPRSTRIAAKATTISARPTQPARSPNQAAANQATRNQTSLVPAAATMNNPRSNSAPAATSGRGTFGQPGQRR